MQPIVTLTTDFGFGSYVAQMKAVLLGYRRDIQIVDIAHDIAAQNILQAAMVLADATTRFPRDTLHLAIVDPGVGTDRKLIYVEAGSWRYLLPDNGLIGMVANRWPVERAIHLTQSQFWATTVAPTFHGRDIVSHVAGHLLQGANPLHLGNVIDKWAKFPIERPSFEGNRLEGRVLSTDHFGNLISNITRADFDQFCSLHGHKQSETQVRIVGTDAAPIWSETYGTQADGSVIAIFDSQDRLEIARVNGSAALFLNLPVGTKIEVVIRSNFC